MLLRMVLKQACLGPIIMLYVLRFDDEETPSRGRHKFSHLWLVQSGVGIVGTLLNGIVLQFFYKEGKSLISSVNAMLV